MVDRTSSGSPVVARAKWPYLGQPQALLLIAGFVTVGASFLPWVPTVVGDLGGNGGQITFYAGMIALPGAIWRRAGVVATHALVLAVPALVLPLYRLGWATRQLPGFGDAWLPGAGLVLVAISGGVALYAAVRLLQRASSHAE
ncbi:hypothetical protein BH23ACT10_BH23ACT10_02770 [soil metagenome]